MKNLALKIKVYYVERKSPTNSTKYTSKTLFSILGHGNLVDEGKKPFPASLICSKSCRSHSQNWLNGKQKSLGAFFSLMPY